MAADPTKPLIHRLVNTKTWSVEDTSKWITDEHEEGSYDYYYKETESNTQDIIKMKKRSTWKKIQDLKNNIRKYKRKIRKKK